jgi:hypothetical protein
LALRVISFDFSSVAIWDLAEDHVARSPRR